MADLGTRFGPYRAVLASRVRSQRAYRASFRLDLASSFLISLVEFAEVWVLFHAVDDIGGLDLTRILLVFGIADAAFCLADLVVGHCDRIPDYLRQGTWDVFYLRPQPLLAQLISSDISLRRLTRAGVGLSVLGVGLVLNDIDWSPAKVLLLVLAFASAIAIFAAQFIAAAGLQFFLINGAELTNAFVYGGRYAATQPASVWGRPLWALFAFFFPMAFTAYLPTLTLLDLPAPHHVPDWSGWLAPLFALWAWGFAMFSWRIGVRHYQGGGG